MALTLPALSSRPFGSGPRYPLALAAASTRSRTSSRTTSGRLKTFEAVAFETPAASSASRADLRSVIRAIATLSVAVQAELDGSMSLLD